MEWSSLGTDNARRGRYIGAPRMTTRSEKVRRFRDLHKSGCFTMPNPWDVGGARVMTALGFEAVATTSSGYAFSQGKKVIARDVGREEALRYAAPIAASTELPV